MNCPTIRKEIVTHVDHSSVISYCLLPWPVRSASPALLHGRFSFHPFFGSSPGILSCCARSSQIPFPQRTFMGVFLCTLFTRVCFRCVACCLLFTLDSVYNGAPTLTLLNFLRVNVSSVSLFYGSAPWHYYLTQAFPLLVGPTLPFVLHGAYLAFMESSRHRRLLLYTVIWTSAVFSCVGHKEWRFLHPLVPIMHLLAARSLISLYDRSSPRNSPRNTGLSMKRTHLVLLTLLSIAPSLYVMRWHSSAQIGVLSYLRDRPDTELRSIGFLMPCHSTPAQSHLHRRIPLWHLSCEPPLQ